MGFFRDFRIFRDFDAIKAEKCAFNFSGLTMDVSTEMRMYQKEIDISAVTADMDGLSCFKVDFVIISRIF